MILSFLEQYYTAIFILFLVALIGLSYFFGLEEGRKKGDSGVVISCPLLLEKKPSTSLLIEGSASSQQEASPQVQGVAAEATPSLQGRYVGSKNGTKYYTPGCPGTNRIKPENYIWFQTAEDATLQGYSKGSC